MIIPEHVNPTTPERALAPYNFVPLPERVITVDPSTLPDQDRYDPDRCTGYIDCVITTESPIYVRGPLTPDEFERQETGQDGGGSWRDQVRNKPDFFYTHAATAPRIPGSSLRGMLRQLVEIISYSKMQWVSNDPLVYRAVGDTTTHGNRYRERVMREDGTRPNRAGKPTKHYTPLVKAGYIEEDQREFRIRPAKEINGTTFARIGIDNIPDRLAKIRDCKNACEIWFQAGPYDYQDVRGGFLRIKYARVIRASGQEAPGLTKGALVYSGPMASKRSETVIYPPDERARSISIPDELVLAYKDQVSQEQEHLLGRKGGVLRNGQPVFYLQEGDKLIFFGHTMMMRLPYPHTPVDFIPECLRKKTDLDVAEALFGYTKSEGEGKARAYASRVFVSDALLEPNQSGIWLSDAPIVPKILGGPKPTTFQHYVTQATPDPQEQGRDRNGNPKLVRERLDYTDKKRSVIRGHKLYWHKGEIKAADVQEASDRLRDEQGRVKESDTQHTQIRPVKAGVRFRWRIRFENLSKEELGALLWALTLPGRSGQEYRHSIGMGKPYGMGAIKVEPTLTLEDRRRGYSALFDGAGWLEASKDASARIPTFIGDFDRFVRHEIGAEDTPTLAGVERIQMLLKMLEWPGPGKELTRYLEIERQDPTIKRGKINEYKGRPVLPDPLHIAVGSRAPATAPASGQRPQPTGRRPHQDQRPAPAAPRSTPEAKPTPGPTAKAELELSHPASIAEVSPGMYLEGKVVRTESGRVVVDILGEEATLSRDAISPPIRDDYDLEERFPKDKIVRVWVKGRNKSGRIQLTMRRN